MPSQPQLVWSLYHTRRIPAEEAADPSRELFVPVAADEAYESFHTAEEEALRLMETEDWEVGLLVTPVGGERPWQLEWLEPASPLQRREVVAGDLPGFEWVRAAPPRRDREQAIYELRQAWKKSEGRRGYAVERQALSSTDLTRILLEFRERAIY